MLPSLSREGFLDADWDRAAFDELLEFWVRSFDAARTDDTALKVRAGVRLWCVPRTAGAELERELSRALATAGVAATVRRADDTLTITFDAPALGVVVTALGAPAARGLAAEVSFAVEHGGAATAFCPKSATLVAVGETRAEGVCVKALCGHAGAGPNPGTWTYGTEWDGPILEAFEEFRATRAVSPQLMSLAQESEQNRRNLAEYIARQERARAPRREWPFALRFVVYAALCALPVLAMLAMQLLEAMPPNQNKLLLRLAGGLSGITFTIVMLRELADAPARRRALRAASEENYRTLMRYAPLSATDELAQQLDDPLVRNVTADVLAEGFTLAGDVADVPHESATVVHRAFRAPDGVTYLVFTFATESPIRIESASVWRARWPVVCTSVLCQTFLREVDRVETMNHEHPFAAVGRTPPCVHFAAVPPETHWLDQYREHSERVKDWAADTGSRPVKHEPFERFVERQNEIAELEYVAYWNRPAPAAPSE
jgi:hypothetical protein